MESTAVLTPPSLHELDTTSGDDPFELGLTVTTEIGADRVPTACGTGDGCAGTCASSCTSAV